MEFVNIFSEKFVKIIESGLKSVQLESNEKDFESEISSDQWSSSEDKKSCSYCRIQFSDGKSQREHYKLDWHRFNLKQSLLSKNPITEEEFFKKTTENDDLSSISGSDSEKEEENLDSYANAQGKIFFKNNENVVFSIYKCVLFDRKDEVNDELVKTRLAECSITNQKWTILMLGGGHFAGAVFNGSEPVLHKTFHCYTVRAGQGGSQSTRDSKSGGSHPKSAGASLRRYNEQALVQHVRSIVDSWRSEIEKSSLIIYRASGPYNRGVLFGGNTPLLDRNNEKLRTIPFSTRRATFTEVKRVHQVLSTIYVYDSLETATKKFSPEKQTRRNKGKATSINRAKSRETIERPLPTENNSEEDTEKQQISEENQESKAEIEITTKNTEISFDDLEEYKNSFDFKPNKPKQSQNKNTKKTKKSSNKTKKQKEKSEIQKKSLYETIVNGDLNKLKTLMEQNQQEEVDNVEKGDKDDENLENKYLDEDLNTMLHVAAKNERLEILQYLLLEKSADPCAKNSKLETAYTCTKSKTVREFFRQFARENPDKFNYNKAQIPVNALTNEELAEKKKAIKKVKKEKEKEKRKENEILKKEEEEKQRFLKLSDREKRALAAERRILEKSGKVFKRCFLCGVDMAGKVPFEYLNNLFCSMDCLKGHRLQNPIIMS